MSCRAVEGKWPLESGNGNRGNVVQLHAGGAARAREVQRVVPEAVTRDGVARDGIKRDGLTRDGLDLLKAFFAIGDAPARAAVLLMARRLAGQPTDKR